MTKLTLALLSGGRSPERDVSLSSGDQVFAALNTDKYTVRRYDPKSDLARLVAEAPEIDFALIILHGPYGEDGTIQGLLDLLDIPYQGSGVLGSAVAMDKTVTKQLYAQAGIPAPPSLCFTRTDRGPDVGAVCTRLGLPLVVKPVKGGSSIGMSIVRDPKKLPEALHEAFKVDAHALAEPYLQGIEITVGVIGNQELLALPVIEIIPGDQSEFFNYHAKYTPGATEEICPARIPDAVTEQAQSYALMAHRALFCEGYSRTDMILCGQQLYVLETNTIPGMTRTSLLPQAAAVAGMPFAALLDRLIELGLERRENL